MQNHCPPCTARIASLCCWAVRQCCCRSRFLPCCSLHRPWSWWARWLMTWPARPAPASFSATARQRRQLPARRGPASRLLLRRPLRRWRQLERSAASSANRRRAVQSALARRASPAKQLHPNRRRRSRSSSSRRQPRRSQARRPRQQQPRRFLSSSSSSSSSSRPARQQQRRLWRRPRPLLLPARLSSGLPRWQQPLRQLATTAGMMRTAMQPRIQTSQSLRCVVARGARRAARARTSRWLRRLLHLQQLQLAGRGGSASRRERTGWAARRSRSSRCRLQLVTAVMKKRSRLPSRSGSRRNSHDVQASRALMPASLPQLRQVSRRRSAAARSARRRQLSGRWSMRRSVNSRARRLPLLRCAGCM